MSADEIDPTNERGSPPAPEAATPAPPSEPVIAQPHVPPPEETPPLRHVPFEAFLPPLEPRLHERILAYGTDYFLRRDPRFWSLLAPLLVVSLILFTRWPGTNYIFDEQEAHGPRLSQPDEANLSTDAGTAVHASPLAEIH